jgi:tetratricopeptide (TPR) repeat protein
MSLPFSAGSMYSTVGDLYLWNKALYTEDMLSDKYKNIMFKPFLNNYAYGWGVGKILLAESKDSLQVISHGGGINGFNTLITRLVDDKYLIVLLNNTGGTALNKMSIGITNILYGKPYDEPQKSIAESLFNTLLEKSIASTIEHYHDLKKKYPDNYNFSEGELNRLGYRLLGLEKVDEAIKIFKLNVEVYPTSSNVYDSYGEGLMKNNENAKAIINYKKSLELNPGNTNGIEMLKKLGVDTESLAKEVTVEDDILESYVGKYELAPGFVLTVSKYNSQLKAQATGQSEQSIFPKSKNVFYYKVVEAQLTFNLNEDGIIESVTLFQGGQEIFGKKIPAEKN